MELKGGLLKNRLIPTTMRWLSKHQQEVQTKPPTPAPHWKEHMRCTERKGGYSLCRSWTEKSWRTAFCFKGRSYLSSSVACSFLEETFWTHGDLRATHPSVECFQPHLFMVSKSEALLSYRRKLLVKTCGLKEQYPPLLKLFHGHSEVLLLLCGS